MITLVCDKCGGKMKRIGNTNEAECEFCGNRIFISAADENTRSKFKEMFKDFVKELDGAESEEHKIISEQPETEEVQELADTFLVELTSRQNSKIQIHALYQQELQKCTMYVTRENVLFKFSREHTDSLHKYVHYGKKIAYPTEAMQRTLHSYLPENMKQIPLIHEEQLLVINKLKNTYPAGLLKPLQAEHVAWIVSRLENLACLLAYNGITLHNLTLDDIFIDPKNHQVLLYGGWWSGEDSMNHRSLLQTNRRIGKEMAGMEHIPEPMRKFMQSSPKGNANEDFAYWDECLTQSFGKRRFIKIERSEREIYQ